MAMKTLELIQKGPTMYGHSDGFLYLCTSSKGDVRYWRCRRKEECKARLVTVNAAHSVLIRKGGDAASHTDPPSPEEVEAIRYVARVKAAAAEHSDRPPSAILRIVHDADEAVQALLPTNENLKKTIQREVKKGLPPNPMHIEVLAEIPDTLRRTAAGDNFLLYDSRDDEDYDLDHRIIIFGTRQNLKLLFNSDIWFVDGTFQVVPSILFQLFTIMGSVSQKHKGTE